MNKRFELIWRDTGEVYYDNKTGYEYGVSPQYRFHIRDLLNEMNMENEELKQVLGNILFEVKREISNTHRTGEVKVFINPNSYDLISEILKKYK